MEDYAECRKYHSHMGGMTDGCQEFMEDSWNEALHCEICGCHRNFHRKVFSNETEVIYTNCHKIHDFKFQNSVDGCQEFIPTAQQGARALICATCGCNKGYHRNEVTREVTLTKTSSKGSSMKATSTGVSQEQLQSILEEALKARNDAKRIAEETTAKEEAIKKTYETMLAKLSKMEGSSKGSGTGEGDKDN